MPRPRRETCVSSLSVSARRVSLCSVRSFRVRPRYAPTRLTIRIRPLSCLSSSSSRPSSYASPGVSTTLSATRCSRHVPPNRPTERIDANDARLRCGLRIIEEDRERPPRAGPAERGDVGESGSAPWASVPAGETTSVRERAEKCLVPLTDWRKRRVLSAASCVVSLPCPLPLIVAWLACRPWPSALSASARSEMVVGGLDASSRWIDMVAR